MIAAALRTAHPILTATRRAAPISTIGKSPFDAILARVSWIASQLETAKSRAEFDAAAAANGIDFSALVKTDILPSHTLDDYRAKFIAHFSDERIPPTFAHMRTLLPERHLDPKSTVWNVGSMDDLLLDPDHDCYYFVDTSIVVAYHSREFPFLNRYIDTMSLKGPRFFVTSRIAAGFTNAPLPAPFKIFRDKEASIRVDSAYPTVVAWFKLGTPSAQFKVDICWLLESWYCLCSCYDIPPEDIVNGRAFALTMNAELVGRFIEDPASNRRLERIIDERALEHLASVRHLACDGTFRDLMPLLPL